MLPLFSQVDDLSVAFIDLLAQSLSLATLYVAIAAIAL
jgi:hypothetical protein